MKNVISEKNISKMISLIAMGVVAGVVPHLFQEAGRLMGRTEPEFLWIILRILFFLFALIVYLNISYSLDQSCDLSQKSDTEKKIDDVENRIRRPEDSK